MSRRLTSTLPLAWVTPPTWLTTSSALRVTTGGGTSAPASSFGGSACGLGGTPGSDGADARLATTHSAAATARGARADGGREWRRGRRGRNTRSEEGWRAERLAPQAGPAPPAADSGSTRRHRLRTRAASDAGGLLEWRLSTTVLPARVDGSCRVALVSRACGAGPSGAPFHPPHEPFPHDQFPPRLRLPYRHRLGRSRARARLRPLARRAGATP